MKLTALCMILLMSQSALANIVMYTDRPENVTNVIVNAFKAKYPSETVDVVYDKDKPASILDRLNAEGPKANGADVILVKDLVYFNQLDRDGFFQPYNSSLRGSVNPLMSSDNWIAVTYRARTVIYNKTSVDPKEIQTYADLTNDAWAGSLCLRSSSSAYNQALVATLIADNGETNTRSIVDGWVQNLAQAIDPKEDDTSIVNKVIQGTNGCEVAVVNTYYVGRILSAKPEVASTLGVHFVNGTHTNGASVGISDASTQQDLANKLIEVMLSPDVQTQIVASTNEFPANINVAHPSPYVDSWLQTLKSNPQLMSPTPWDQLTPYLDASKSLMKSVNYN